MEHDLAIMLAAAILLALLRLLPEFRILVTPNGVKCSGALLQGRATAIEYFFVSVLKFRGQLKITGRQTSTGDVKLRFRGKISEKDRQRFCEFLPALLQLASS
jgi:hypothetical protein